MSNKDTLNQKPGQGNVQCKVCIEEGIDAGEVTFETAQEYETHRSAEHRPRPGGKKAPAKKK